MFLIASPTEASAENEFHDETIAGVANVVAHSEINLPFGRDIQIDAR